MFLEVLSLKKLIYIKPIKQMKIKNIIFDLGKVITAVSFDKTSKEFSLLSGKSIGFVNKFQEESSIFKDVEINKISLKTFRNIIRETLEISVSDNDIDTAWNEMIGETPKRVLEYLDSLRPQFKTYILSNTNRIHIDCIHKKLQEKYEIKNLLPYFDKVYLSFEIGSRKPDKEAYLFVLNENNLKANETLFIDDKQENLDTANILGIQTLLKTEDKTLEQHLEKLFKE